MISAPNQWICIAYPTDYAMRYVDDYDYMVCVVSDQGVNNETQDVSQIMHCCLDVQSNFIFNKQNFIFERKTLFAFSDMNRNTIHGNNLNNHFLIRAPPSLVKN